MLRNQNDPTRICTLKQRPKQRGAEADECYIFGDHDAERIHLAIEVVCTSGRIDKLGIYRKLGVAEVWYWRNGRIQPCLLQGEHYLPVAASQVLLGLDLELPQRFLDQPAAYDAILAFHQALRTAEGG